MTGFDYIVGGGGTAGCVLAARLSEDPGTGVLLLEAGGSKTTPRDGDPAACFSLRGTPVDWADATIPPARYGRAVIPSPRGNVLRESSAINGMMHVRGDRTAFDAWERAGRRGVELRRTAEPHRRDRCPRPAAPRRDQKVSRRRMHGRRCALNGGRNES